MSGLEPSATNLKGVAGPRRLVPPPSTNVLMQAATFQEAILASISPNTLRGYTSDLRQFRRWLAGYREEDKADQAILDSPAYATTPRSPEEIVRYLLDKANVMANDGSPKYSVVTLRRHLAGISWEHKMAGLSSPTKDPAVDLTMRGLDRLRARPVKRAEPLLLEPLREILQSMDLRDPVFGCRRTRDAALMLIGFAGAFRGSELGALNFEDVRLSKDGLMTRITRSKTDQTGRGATKAMPFGDDPVTCPPCAYVRWVRLLFAYRNSKNKLVALHQALLENDTSEHCCRGHIRPNISGGEPLFRTLGKGGHIHLSRISTQTITHAIKRWSAEAGIDNLDMSSHSLRAGFITDAFNAGATTNEIMRQSLHRNPSTVQIYDRENNPLRRNAATRLRF